MNDLDLADRKLSQMRESCHFYLKIDFGVIAAIATALSLFKLEGSGLLELGTEYRSLALALLWLILCGLAFDFGVVRARMGSDDDRAKWLPILSFVHVGLGLGHVGALAYSIGFVQAWLECLACSTSPIP